MESASSSTLTQENTQGCEAHFAKPQAEHQWLQKLVGEWTFESECVNESGQGMKSKGTESVRAFGDIWILGDGKGEMPGGGGEARMLVTLGYDPQRQRFVGTWIGSMMTHLWIYEGQLDAAKRVLTLDAEGPSFMDPKKTARYQDIIEVMSDDHRILRSRTLGEDGKWTQFMTAHYRRSK